MPVATLPRPLPAPTLSARSSFAAPQADTRLLAPESLPSPLTLTGPALRIPSSRSAVITGILQERVKQTTSLLAVDEAEDNLFRAAQKAGGRTPGALLFPETGDPAVELQVLQTTVNVHVHRLTDLSAEISELEGQIMTAGRFKKKIGRAHV